MNTSAASRSIDYDNEDTDTDSMSDEEENEFNPDKIAQCIRNVANFSHVKSFHLMEKKDFNPEMLSFYIKEAAPKIEALFEQIEKLDEKDLKTHGKLFKHMIFTDMKSSNYGAKILASAFVAKGYQPAIHVQGTGFTLYKEDKLEETENQNFGVLMSKKFFDRPMNIKFRKSMLELYNRRPENIHGEYMRFIILDQGFKEGIDLFDVKYVHLFEPLVVRADEKQAIGRGTRFCGQKGLEFHPRFGWPLYVFRYEVGIPKELQPNFHNTKYMFELYLKYSIIDLRKVVFAAEIEKASIEAAVDVDLTRPIHQFSIELPPPILSGGAPILRSKTPTPPTQLMSLDSMHRYIAKGFQQFEYPKVKLENLCGTAGGSAMGNIVNFTPTQDFIRHYFQPSSAYKGMLLFHSVGTGKTCTAIATASTSFEKEGYNILWVTRHTLKSDIWKNMYGQVCSLVIQEQLKNKTLKLPTKISGPMKYVSNNWMEPISYKQFSNLLLKKNKIYDEIVRRNGKVDPLRKTLVIIDEAHKLYSPTVAASEKPNTDILEEMIQNSYEKSGKDSVRILLMTATPYTEDGMEMVKLLNLLRAKKVHMPITFEDFGKKYLDDHGYFHKNGLKHYKDEVSGYISYLNRSQDARNFAHPVLENIVVPLSYREEEKEEEEELEEGQKKKKKARQSGKFQIWMKELREHITTNKKNLKELKNNSKNVLKRSIKRRKEQGKKALGECKEEVATKKNEALEKAQDTKEKEIKECKEKVKTEQKPCKDKASEKLKDTTKKIKEKASEDLKDCKETVVVAAVSAQALTEEEDDIIEEMNLLEVMIQENKEELVQVQGIVKQRREKRKEMTEELKDLLDTLKEIRIVFKKLKRTVTKEQKRIKNIKDVVVRKREQLQLRQNKGAEMKEMHGQVQDLRVRISIIRVSKKVMLLQEGKPLSDVSQAKALNKRCGLSA